MIFHETPPAVIIKRIKGNPLLFERGNQKAGENKRDGASRPSRLFYMILNFEAGIVVFPIFSEVSPVPEIPEVFFPQTVTLPSEFNIALNQEPAAPARAAPLICTGDGWDEAEPEVI